MEAIAIYVAIYVALLAVSGTVFIASLWLGPEKLDFMSQFYVEEPRKVWGVTLSYRAQCNAALIGFFAFYAMAVLSTAVTVPVCVPVILWELAFGNERSSKI